MRKNRIFFVPVTYVSLRNRIVHRSIVLRETHYIKYGFLLYSGDDLHRVATFGCAVTFGGRALLLGLNKKVEN